MSRTAEELEAQLITPRVTRRAALASFAAAAALASTPRLARARQPDLPVVARKARNVIFMVSDGMSAGTLTLADLYARKTQNRHCHWVRLLADKLSRRALQTTHSADGPVTDSAAAASSWATGHKFTNGAINITPDGRQHIPILIHAAQNGKKTGLVTTTRITHATPAGFCANVPVRDQEADIARQQVERRIDVLLGGGAVHFPDTLIAKAEGEGGGATIVRDAAALSAVDPATPRPLIGLFAKYHMPFITDRADTVPSLPAMTTKALDILGRADNGFVLQIEGGRVDHAAHSSDAWALIREQTEFDETIAIVEQFLEGRDDTLLIITTDHGNANPGLTLYAKRGQEAFDLLTTPQAPRKSFEWIYDQLAATPAADKIAALPDLVEQATGIKLGETELRILTASIKGQRVSPFAAANTWTFILGSLLADHFGIAFASPNHTADLVELLARGPGSEAIPPVVDNTDLHAIMVAALGLAPAQPLPGFDQLVPVVKPKTDD